MKCVIPEISWHNRDPVLSVDIQPKRAGDTSAVYRLASGGTDSHVLVGTRIVLTRGCFHVYNFRCPSTLFVVDLVCIAHRGGHHQLGHCGQSDQTPATSERGAMVTVRRVSRFGRRREYNFRVEIKERHGDNQHFRLV